MYHYTPRFSPSTGSGADHHHHADGVDDVDLVRSPSAAKSFPTGGYPCWLCERQCSSTGYRDAPALFFPAEPPRAESGWAQSNLGNRQSLFPSHRGEGGAAGAPCVSSFTLCENCATAVDAEEREADYHYPAQPSRRFMACHSEEYVANVRGYKALLQTLSEKVVRASQTFASAISSPSGGGQHGRVDGAATTIVAVTAETPLTRTTPQLQRKVLTLLLDYLEGVTEKDFQSRQTRSGAASYYGTGPAMMRQEERNIFLKELITLERVLATTQSHTAENGTQTPQLLSSASPLAVPRRHPRHVDGTQEMRTMARLLSSSPVHRPEVLDDGQRRGRDVPVDDSPPPRGHFVSHGGGAGGGTLEGMVENGLRRAAGYRDDHSRSGASRDSSPRSNDLPQPYRGGGREDGKTLDAMPEPVSEDDDTVLLNYFARRLHDSRRSVASTDDRSSGRQRPSGFPPGGPPPPRAPSQSPTQHQDRRAALVTAPNSDEQQQQQQQQLETLESRLEHELARRQEAEQALSEARQRVASLEKVTNDMGERLLTSQLSFSPAFHLNHLNDFYSNVVTFFQLFCMRKSMQFAEEVSAVMREVSSRRRPSPRQRASAAAPATALANPLLRGRPTATATATAAAGPGTHPSCPQTRPSTSPDNASSPSPAPARPRGGASGAGIPDGSVLVESELYDGEDALEEEEEEMRRPYLFQLPEGDVAYRI